jgi:hypothetical protein
MEKLTHIILDKINLVNALIILAILTFAVQMIQIAGGMHWNNPYEDKAKLIFYTVMMSLAPALYKPAFLIAAAKIIQILEKKSSIKAAIETE